MSCYYDLHIHTALSPCGDDDMTPNNVINMSALKGLDVIAVTDHNSAKNVRACVECGRKNGIIVLPGMEIETSEEIHMVALFKDVDTLGEMQDIVLSKLPPVKNKPAIFGEQIIMDKHDRVLGFKEQFLITACSMDVFEVADTVRSLGGVVFPAHIDKSSYSLLSNLGSIPDELKLSTVEVKKNPVPQNLLDMGILDKYNVLHNSDAHYLWDISEKENYIECKSAKIEDILYKISTCI